MLFFNHSKRANFNFVLQLVFNQSTNIYALIMDQILFCHGKCKELGLMALSLKKLAIA